MRHDARYDVHWERALVELGDTGEPSICKAGSSFVACPAVSPTPRICHRHEPSFLLRPAARPTLILLLLHPSHPLHDLFFEQHLRLSVQLMMPHAVIQEKLSEGAGEQQRQRQSMYVDLWSTRRDPFSYLPYQWLARPLPLYINRDHLPYSLSFPFTPAIYLHNRLPTHPSPPSAPQNHVSIFLTCIHRVRSDHSYKSQLLASLSLLCTRPHTTRRPPIAVASRRETGHSTPSTHDRGGAVEQRAVSVGLVRLYLLTQIIADINSSTHQLIADDAPMRLAHGARSCVQPPPAVCPWSHLDARASAGDNHVSQTQARAQCQCQRQCFQPSVL